jgi:transcriptional regulator with XRE-family HTH domain
MTLAELIAAHRGDVSYERLAKRAGEAGYEISAAMIHNYATKPLTNIPRVETLRAVAAALRVDPRTVLDAAAEAVGLSPREPDHGLANQAQVQAIVSLVRDRPASELEHVRRVLGDVVHMLDNTVARSSE